MTENKAVAKRDPIYNLLAANKGAIKNVLPTHLTPEKVLRVAYTMIHKTPKLRDCNEASIINAVIEASILGLDIGRTAHIIPFKRTAVLIVDYKGFIDLAHRSGQIESFPFKPVYLNDDFEYSEGTTRYIKHQPFRGEDRGPLVAAYAICFYKHGGYDFEVVEAADIAATKARSPSKNKADSPWNQEDLVWTMWCKTAVRRLAKRVPQSPDLMRAAFLDELYEAGVKQDLGHVQEMIDIEHVESVDLTRELEENVEEDASPDPEAGTGKKSEPDPGKEGLSQGPPEQSEKGPKGEPKDPVKEFDRLTYSFHGPELDSYLEKASNVNELSVGDMKGFLLGDFDGFMLDFGEWRKKNRGTKAPEQTEGAENPWIPQDKWWKMRAGNFKQGTGFLSFCVKNKDSYGALPGEIRRLVEFKISNVYGEVGLKDFAEHMGLTPGPDLELEVVYCEPGEHQLTATMPDGRLACSNCPYEEPMRLHPEETEDVEEPPTEINVGDTIRQIRGYGQFILAEVFRRLELAPARMGMLSLFTDGELLEINDLCRAVSAEEKDENH